MKKRGVWLALLLILLFSSGCRKQEPESVETPEPSETEKIEQEEPVARGELRVEISRGGLTTQQLADAAKTLPELFRVCLRESGAEVESVRVTVGTSGAATAQTLAAGNIDLAFLPVEEFLEYGGGAIALYADGYETENGVSAGQQSLICAAPTEYGRQLAQRAASKQTLTWRELDRARWGVLEEDAFNGHRDSDLWLADHYEGNRLAELSEVTVYGSYEELLRAAAAEELDAFVIRDDARLDVAEAWMLDADRTNENGLRGFGRSMPVLEEVQVLDTTERMYRVVAAVAPELGQTDAAFTAALGTALETMAQEYADWMLSLGAQRFAALEPEALMPMRRLAALEAE